MGLRLWFSGSLTVLPVPMVLSAFPVVGFSGLQWVRSAFSHLYT